jgi:hypothetical protein
MEAWIAKAALSADADADAAKALAVDAEAALQIYEPILRGLVE